MYLDQPRAKMKLTSESKRCWGWTMNETEVTNQSIFTTNSYNSSISFFLMIGINANLFLMLTISIFFEVKYKVFLFTITIVFIFGLLIMEVIEIRKKRVLEVHDDYLVYDNIIIKGIQIEEITSPLNGQYIYIRRKNKNFLYALSFIVRDTKELKLLQEVLHGFSKKNNVPFITTY